MKSWLILTVVAIVFSLLDSRQSMAQNWQPGGKEVNCWIQTLCRATGSAQPQAATFRSVLVMSTMGMWLKSQTAASHALFPRPFSDRKADVGEASGRPEINEFGASMVSDDQPQRWFAISVSCS